FNKQEAERLLDDAGWTLKPGAVFRTNDSGELMQFTLYYVENPDRKSVAEQIKNNLKSIGIDVKITQPDSNQAWTLKELNNQVLSPRLFDVLLYGMNTFVDPDRYELYHSSQINY